MKTRIFAILAMLVLALSVFVGCGSGNGNGGNGEGGEGNGNGEVTVNTHAEYLAGAKGDEMVVDTYVQNKQGWWE